MWEYFFLERPFLVAFIAIFILFPLSITEKMQSLRFISLISLLSIFSFIAVVVIYYFAGDVERYQEGSIVLFRFDIAIFSVLSTCTFAFACHTSLLPISKGLRLVPLGEGLLSTFIDSHTLRRWRFHHDRFP